MCAGLFVSRPSATTAVGTHPPWFPLLVIALRESATVRPSEVLLVFGCEADRLAGNIQSVVLDALDLAKEELPKSLA